MKIGFLGLDLPEGKTKYNDPILIKLTEKFDPKKVSPFFAEFIKEDFINADCIVVAKDKILDLLIMDIEKVDNRIANSKDPEEIAALKKCQEQLENEIPACEIDFTEQEKNKIKELAPLSFKPTLVIDGEIDINDLIRDAFYKTQMMFFYTAGKQEVRSWPVKKGSDAVTCAGKIHSDLARGFIKAEIVNFRDFENVHNMQQAKNEGMVKLVDKDHVIEQGDIIEIRFNV
jgi:ribosome-binding ATPase YchF (GTP1/OBG family)